MVKAMLVSGFYYGVPGHTFGMRANESDLVVVLSKFKNPGFFFKKIGGPAYFDRNDTEYADIFVNLVQILTPDGRIAYTLECWLKDV